MSTQDMGNLLAAIIAAGGGGAVVAYLLFQTLGKGWLDAKFAERLATFKHEQDKEIQRLKIEVESVLSGALKMQDREFQVLPDAWEKLNEAYMAARSLASPLRNQPNLSRMSAEELEELLASAALPESQKIRVRSASADGGFRSDRQALFQEIRLWQELHVVLTPTEN